jgi:arylsulfatase A-like enzyme
MKYDHILFVSVDTLRSDCIAANPLKLWPSKYRTAKQPRTDLIDRLATEGAFFPNTISAAPYTSASHASIFTGKWPLRHGLFEYFNRRLGSDTVFTEMRRMGYRTFFKVDFPLILGPFLGFDRDADEYVVEQDEKVFDAVRQGGPMAAFIHFGGVHIPYGFHNSHYGGSDYVEKVRSLEEEIDSRYPMPDDQIVETYRSKEDLDLLLRYKRVIQYHYEEKHYDRLFDLYLEGVDYFMKRRFDPFMEKLLSLLEGKRYLIVMFGDHGEEYDESSLGHFNTVSEGVIRVPMLFYGQGVAPAIHRDRIRTVDVAPTLLQHLGVVRDRVDALDGVSLLKTVWHNEPYEIRPAFAQTYISEATALVDFQKKMLAEGKKPGLLRHARYKEAVYDGNDKLSRQEHAYQLVDGAWSLRPCETISTFETLGPDTVPRPAEAPDRARTLAGMLERYNQIEPEESELATITDAIRGDLQSMGYKV